jgi:Fe-S cluster assembly iron-binding protein IscA
MVGVTERAKDRLKRIWSNNAEDASQGLRLCSRVTGEYDLIVDREKEGDQVVEHEGARILLVAEDVGRALDGGVVDFVFIDGRARLIITAEYF